MIRFLLLLSGLQVIKKFKQRLAGQRGLATRQHGNFGRVKATPEMELSLILMVELLYLKLYCNSTKDSFTEYYRTGVT